jgi:hypothetical protein
MRAVSTRSVLVVMLLVALVLAGVVSFYASGSPDGLNRVAADLGFADAERASGAEGGPLAGYATAGVDNARWSGGLAGVVGCLMVLGCSWLLFSARKHVPALVRAKGE